MQRRSLFRVSASMALLGSTLGLAACGGGGNDIGVVPGPGPAPAPAQPPAPAPGVRTFAHVANYASSNISIFEVEASGMLKPLGTALAGAGATAVAFHPTGRFAYAVNGLDNTVAAYGVNAETGLLHSVPPDVAAGVGPGEIRIHPSGKFAYVLTFDDERLYIYDIDPETGVLRASAEPPLVPSGYPRGIALDAAGGFLYLATGDSALSSYAIDAGTGGLSFHRSVATSSYPGGVVISPSGDSLHVVTSPTISTFPIANGEFGTPSSAEGDNVHVVTFDPSGRYMYATSDLVRAVLIYRVNEQGELDPPQFKDTSPKVITSLATSPSGQCLYAISNVDNTVTAFRIDPDTGALVEGLQSLTAGSEPANISFIQIAR